MAAVLTLKRRIQEELVRYLDPVEGGAAGTGWEIGELPSPNQLATVLKGVEGLLYIQSLEVAYIRGFKDGGAIMNYIDAKADRFVLPQNGRHEIRLFEVRDSRFEVRT